jgi:hypothetical protein
MNKIYFEKCKKHKKSKKKHSLIHHHLENEWESFTNPLLDDSTNDQENIDHTYEEPSHYIYVEDDEFSERNWHHSSHDSEDNSLSDIESITVLIRTKSGETIDLTLHLDKHPTI